MAVLTLKSGKHSGKTFEQIVTTDRNFVEYMSEKGFTPAIRSAASAALNLSKETGFDQYARENETENGVTRAESLAEKWDNEEDAQVIAAAKRVVAFMEKALPGKWRAALKNQGFDMVHVSMTKLGIDTKQVKVIEVWTCIEDFKF